MAHLADSQRPWMGLASFTEGDRAFFAGRGEEIDELLRLVRRDTLTLLYGVSGLGKTSLLQAGLFPSLRAEDFLPVPIRLDYLEDAPPLSAQVLRAITIAASAARVDTPESCPNETLWEFFHREGNHFWGPRNDLVVPFLVFDQFEELFTIGRENHARARRASEFIRELADLVENCPPGALREHPQRAREFSFKPAPLKVLLAMREDYLAELDQLRSQFRTFGQNRLRLLPMGGSQAGQVINLGAPLLAPGVADRIVEFVAGSNSDAAEITVAPALLSLVLRELNERRLARGPEAKITPDLLDLEQKKILEDFYLRTLHDFPAGARNFVEDKLLTATGYRNSCALDDALSCPDVTQPILDELVNRRLLSYEDRHHARRVEISHDVLTAVASASRRNRREREANALLAARQQERLRRQRRIAFAVVTTLLLCCAALVAYANRARREVKFRELLEAGNFLLETGDNAHAIEQFKEAQRLKPAAAEAWSGMGDALLRQTYGSGAGNTAPILSEAIAAFKKAIEKTKHAATADSAMGKARLAEAYVRLGDVYVQQTDPDFSTAEALYQQAASTDPASPYPHAGEGNLQLKQGHFQLALAQYEASLKAAEQRNEPNYSAHAGMGEVYLNLGHYRLAIEEFNRAIGANPDSLFARFRLASAIHMNDRADPRAAALFESLLGSNMKRIDSLARIDLAYMLLEKSTPPADAPLLAKAVTYLEQAYARDPSAFSAFALGVGRVMQGHAEEGAKLWKEASKLPWGGDPLYERTYPPLLAILRGEPQALARLQKATQFLAQQGTVGFLEIVKLRVELIHRSGLYDAQIRPVIALLDEAVSVARKHNKLPMAGPDRQPASSPQ